MIKIHFGKTLLAIQHKLFYLTCPMVLNCGGGNTAVGRDIWYVYVDCFSWIWPKAALRTGLFSLKISACWLQRRRGVLNKKLSTFNFVPKRDSFLSKIPPISLIFVKHKRYWTFNITQSLCLRQKCIFFVIHVSKCCSASLPSVYLTA